MYGVHQKEFNTRSAAALISVVWGNTRSAAALISVVWGNTRSAAALISVVWGYRAPRKSLRVCAAL